jgi:hypothetical protein
LKRGPLPPDKLPTPMWMAIPAARL